VVINNLNVKRVAVFKPEAQSPLLIDSHTPAGAAITREFFQSIPGRRFQEFYRLGTVQHNQFSFSL